VLFHKVAIILCDWSKNVVFQLPSQVAAIASTPETQDKSGEQSGGLGTLKNLLWGGGSK